MHVTQKKKPPVTVGKTFEMMYRLIAAAAATTTNVSQTPMKKGRPVHSKLSSPQ